MTIVDDHTRCTWVYLMRHKSETRHHLQSFVQLVETQFSSKVKTIRSDNGQEFIMPLYYSNKGIIHQTSCVSTPQQNGVVERKHRHLLNVARALLFQANLPKYFWGEAILTATYLINRIPTPILSGKPPYEMLYKIRPSYNHLRVFGCLCFASTHAKKPSKFDARATRCIFIGYPYGQKGYRVYEIENRRVFTSRDVIFYEDQFPFSNYSSPSHSPVLPMPFPIPNDGNVPQNCNDNPTPALEQATDISNMDFNASIVPRRSSRPTKPPGYLHDFHIQHRLPSQMSQSSESATVSSLGNPYPLCNFLSYDCLSSPHRAFTSSISLQTEPQSFLQAFRDKNWRDAMRAEIDALENNQTWTLTSLPPGKKSVGCKWVFKVKYKPDGSVERYKACLIVKGFS